MEFRSLVSFSRDFRTNIMFCFIFIIFSCLQSYTFGVSLQPKQSDVGIWTAQQMFVTCSRDDNENDGVLQWINPRGEQIEDNSQSGVYVSGGNKQSSLKLFFINTNKRDSGEYKCQLEKNGQVLSSTSLKLQVYKSIEINAVKESYIGVESETITIACVVKFDSSGTDSQVNWWFNNNMIINGDGQFSTKVTKTGTEQISVRNNLIIRNLTKENEGSYTCKAVTANQHLSEMKNLDINVRVQFRPHFPANTPKHVWISDRTDSSPIFINVTCIVNADPVAAFTWSTGDHMRIENGKLRDKAKVSSIENLSVLSLEYENLQEINDTERDPSGWLRKFICQATNDLGSVQNTYELKIGRLPTSPIIANHFYNNGILTFTLNETYTDPPVDMYRIEIANKQFIYFNATNNLVNNTYEIELDVPQGKHEMIIYARNPVGWSENPWNSYHLAVVSHAAIAQQYIAFVMIGCFIAKANSF